MKTRYLIFAMFLCFSLSGQEKIAKRLALVIGNANYEKGPLENPVNDALLIANTLEKLDFDVMLDTNVATIREFSDIVRDFGRKREQYDVGFIYYAGHGIQVKSENFLLPTKEIFESIYDVQDNGLSVQKIMRYLTGMSNQVNILILDACRDNPYESTWHATRSLKGGGLAKIPPPTGSLIAFSTDAGSTAADGDGKNSVYSTSLAKNMLLENTSLDQVFRNVRTEVITATNMNQRPVESSQLTGEAFYLVISDYENEFEKLYKYFEKEKYFEALEIANYIIAQEQNNKRAYRKRADCYTQLKQYKKAEADYDKVIMELDPSDPSCYNNRGTMWRNLKQYDKALTDYNKALERDTTWSWVYVNRANIYSLLEQYDKAFADYDKAIELSPESSRAYKEKGQALKKLEKFDEALIVLNKALIYAEVDTANISWSSIKHLESVPILDVYIDIANVYSESGQYDKGLAEFDKILQLTKDKEDKALAYNNKAVIYEQLSDYNSAIALYSKAIETESTALYSYHNRARIYYKELNDWDKALADYNKAVELDPLDLESYDARGYFFIDKKEYDNALANFNMYIELDSLSARGYLSRSDANYYAGNYDAVISDYKRILSLDPEDYITYSNLAVVLKNLGRYEEALENCNMSIKINPEYQNPYTTKAQTYQQMQLNDSAVVYYNKVIELNPLSGDAYFRRGGFYSETKIDYEKAKNDLIKAIELKTTWLDAANHSLGISYYYLEQMNLAIEHLSKAIELDSTSILYLRVRGVVFTMLKQYKKAILDYSKIIDLDPKNIYAYTQRANSHKSLKQFDMASADYRRIIELQPKNIDAYLGIADLAWNGGYKIYEDIINAYTDVLKLDQKNSLAYFRRAYVRYSNQEYQESIDDYTVLIELNDSSYLVTAYSNRALAYSVIEKYNEAIDDYAKIIELDSTHILSYIGRANANYTYFQKYDNALIDLEKAFSLISSSAELDSNLLFKYYLNKASIYFKMKKNNEAINNYSNAINLNPTNRSVYYGRIKCYLQNNEFQLAEKDCNTTIKFDNRDPEGYYHMSTIFSGQKKYLKAINMLTIAITRLPDKICEDKAGYWVINSLEGDPITLSKLHVKRGNLYKEIKAYDEMCLDYKKACEIIEFKESAPISESEIFNEYCQ